MLDSQFQIAEREIVGDAVFLMWHSLDHYGQTVVYQRMNGLVPPASQARAQ